MNCVMKVFDYRISKEDAIHAKVYSSMDDLVRDIKRIANTYIDEIAIVYGLKPKVRCWKINLGIGFIDIYDDDCVVGCIQLIGV